MLWPFIFSHDCLVSLQGFGERLSETLKIEADYIEQISFTNPVIDKFFTNYFPLPGVGWLWRGISNLSICTHVLFSIVVSTNWSDVVLRLTSLLSVLICSRATVLLKLGAVFWRKAQLCGFAQRGLNLVHCSCRYRLDFWHFKSVLLFCSKPKQRLFFSHRPLNRLLHQSVADQVYKSNHIIRSQNDIFPIHIRGS